MAIVKKVAIYKNNNNIGNDQSKLSHLTQLKMLYSIKL